MSTLLRSGFVLAVAALVSIAITALPGRAADGSKALRSRVKDLERNMETLQFQLDDTRGQVAAVLSDMEALQLNLQDTQTRLDKAVQSIPAVTLARGPIALFFCPNTTPATLG